MSYAHRMRDAIFNSTLVVTKSFFFPSKVMMLLPLKFLLRSSMLKIRLKSSNIFCTWKYKVSKTSKIMFVVFPE